jgi:hypothetical protein
VHGGSEADNAAVFASPGLLAATGGYPEDARDVGRRDDLLARRAPEAAYAQDAWTEPDRPSLSSSRRIYIDAQPDRVIYFRDERRESVGGSWQRHRSYRAR